MSFLGGTQRQGHGVVLRQRSSAVHDVHRSGGHTPITRRDAPRGYIHQLRHRHQECARGAASTAHVSAHTRIGVGSTGSCGAFLHERTVAKVPVALKMTSPLAYSDQIKLNYYPITITYFGTRCSLAGCSFQNLFLFWILQDLNRALPTRIHAQGGCSKHRRCFYAELCSEKVGVHVLPGRACVPAQRERESARMAVHKVGKMW